MAENLVLQSALSHFDQFDGELIIGGKKVSHLVDKYGTPLYVYDRNVIRKRYESLKALPSDVQVHYAVKANPNLDIIAEMAKYYSGFDVASKGEIQKIIEAGLSPGHANFAGPGKRIDELKFAIEQGIGSISIENPQEFYIIEELCSSLRKTVSVLVRINPPFELAQSGVKMGGGPKQFGIDSENAAKLIQRIMSSTFVRFVGIHIFAGTQNLSADQLALTFDKILGYALSLQKSENIPIKVLNMGGGFGIPLYSHEKELDIESLGKSLRFLLEKYRKDLPETKFVIELGRFLVGECGVYICRVLYKKLSRGQIFLIMDGGMHHHLAASGNFGQSLIRRPMPITVLNKLNAPLQKAHVVGPLCTPLDTFGFVDLPEASEGDLIGVLNSGAYAFSASPQLFLSHPAPKEILV